MSSPSVEDVAAALRDSNAVLGTAVGMLLQQAWKNDPIFKADSREMLWEIARTLKKRGASQFAIDLAETVEATASGRMASK